MDDEPLVRWSVSETLHDAGYRVTQAADALSAMQAVVAPGREADVVLLDLRLPDANDLSVLAAMHAAAPYTKIIMMTAYGSDTLALEARKRGAHSLLNKPFDMSVLPPLIANVMQAP